MFVTLYIINQHAKIWDLRIPETCSYSEKIYELLHLSLNIIEKIPEEPDNIKDLILSHNHI